MGKILKHSTIENVPFLFLMVVSAIMGIWAFYTPPRAEIPKSVLNFISLMIVFAALWTVFVALKRGLDAKFSHGNTALTIGSLEGDDGKQDPAEEESYD